MKHPFALIAILTIAVMSIGALGCSSHSSDFSGTSWQLAEYGAQASPATILDGTTITLYFNADASRITGNGGCNDYFADCVIEGDNITVTNLGSTKMNNDDPPGTMNQENDYFNLLKTAERFELKGDSLTIYCSGGEELHFRAD